MLLQVSLDLFRQNGFLRLSLSIYTRAKFLRTFTDPVVFPVNSSLIVGRLKLLVRNSSNLSGRSVSATMRSCLSSDVLLTLYPANMAAPVSGHWTFEIIVGFGLGLGVGVFMSTSPCTGPRIAAIKTLAPTTAPVPPTTVTTDVVPVTAATFEVAPATTATFELAPVTAALEAAISANSVVGGVEEGTGGATVIDVVAQFTSTSAASTVLSI
eukprot:scaffold150200_cov63-Attheya_sp.AAC.2